MKITSFERLFRSYSPIYLGKIAINWHISNNFGDALSIYLAKKLSGLDTLNTDENPDIQHYQVTGSILSLAKNFKIFFVSVSIPNIAIVLCKPTDVSISS